HWILLELQKSWLKRRDFSLGRSGRTIQERNRGDFAGSSLGTKNTLNRSRAAGQGSSACGAAPHERPHSDPEPAAMLRSRIAHRHGTTAPSGAFPSGTWRAKHTRGVGNNTGGTTNEDSNSHSPVCSDVWRRPGCCSIVRADARSAQRNRTAGADRRLHKFSDGLL